MQSPVLAIVGVSVYLLRAGIVSKRRKLGPQSSNFLRILGLKFKAICSLYTIK